MCRGAVKLEGEVREANARAQEAEAAAARAKKQLEEAQQKLAAATSSSQVSCHGWSSSFCNTASQHNSL